MISEKELRREIEEYENTQPTYQVCEKLATLYIIYDHLYGVKEPQTDSFGSKYSFNSGAEHTAVGRNPDKKTVLPAYDLYVQAKNAYQYGDVPIDKVVKTFETLSQEIKDFLKMLYRNTDTPEERKILNKLISEMNVGNI